MNGDVFEGWFENTLLKNLPQARKVLMEMDKYHSTLSEKTPTMNIKKKKKKMISFITTHLSPPSVKTVLLDKIREANIAKKCVIDVMAAAAGYSVLRLSPYHCIFNPFEMVWNQLKHLARHLNIYTSQPAKIIDLLRNVHGRLSQKDIGKTMLVML